MRLVRVALISILAIGVTVSLASAQAPAAPDNPISAGTNMMFKSIANNITRSADKVDESLYTFKATPEVRSFIQLFGHIADSNYAFCSAVLGEKPPIADVEKTVTTKAGMVKALADSFTYCQKAYGGLTDANAGELLPFFGRKMARVSILDMNTSHDNEHYGNLVTYMRLKGMVPPSSERPPAPAKPVK
jgi:uncharacterized damage-inducible protein DinB